MEKWPKLPKRMTPQEKINREKEVKSLIVADSQAVMVNQDSLNADVIAVPGAKLGHLANSIAWNKKVAKYDSIVIIGGTNNIQHSNEANNYNAKEEIQRG